MKKIYVCKNCGEKYQQKLRPNKCWKCGGTAFRLDITKWIIIAIIVIAAISVLLPKIPHGSNTPSATWTISKDGSDIEFTINGIPNKDMEQYQIKIFVQTDEIATINFPDGSNVTTWSLSHAMPDVCYSFLLFDGEGNEIKVKWNKSTYCHTEEEIIKTDTIEEPPTPITKERPTILIDTVSLNGSYTVTIKLSDNSYAKEYAIDNKWQKSNIFKNIKPGDHTIKTKEPALEDFLVIKINKQKNEASSKIDKNQVQQLLNDVSTKKKSPSDVLDAVGGDAHLKNKINELETLNDVLIDCQLWGNKYKVVSIDIDNKNQKIRSIELQEI